MKATMTFKELSEKLCVKPIYICYKTKLKEVLISEDTYERIFKGFEKHLSFQIDNEHCCMKLTRSSMSVGNFIYGSFGGNLYDVEIAGDINSLLENISIKSNDIINFLLKLERNERDQELLDFANKYKYSVFSDEIVLETNLNESNLFNDRTFSLYKMNNDFKFEDKSFSIVNVEIEQSYQQDKVTLKSFSVKSSDGDFISDKNIIFETINDVVYFKDKNNEWFNNKSYLKTFKIRQQEIILKKLREINEAKDLEQESGIFTL